MSIAYNACTLYIVRRISLPIISTNIRDTCQYVKVKVKSDFKDVWGILSWLRRSIFNPWLLSLLRLESSRRPVRPMMSAFADLQSEAGSRHLPESSSLPHSHYICLTLIWCTMGIYCHHCSAASYLRSGWLYDDITFAACHPDDCFKLMKLMKLDKSSSF